MLGCLLGTLAGDAYGLLHARGEDPSPALGDPSGLTVSDATQLTLSTVDGLVDALEWANDGVAADETACLWLAYLRWLVRQGEHLPPNAPAPPARWLDRQEGLLPVHHADADTLRALRSGNMGTRSRPLNRDAGGPGALIRSAPFGLVPRIPASMVERLTVDGAALTHGADGARAAAARFSGIIRALAIDGLSLDDAVGPARGNASHLVHGNEHRNEHDRGFTASGGTAVPGGSPPPVTAAATLEAAVKAVLSGAEDPASPAGHLAAALARAISTVHPASAAPASASLAGAITGALHGTAALPAAYLEAPGVAAVVRGMGRALLKATTGT